MVMFQWKLCCKFFYHYKNMSDFILHNCVNLMFFRPNWILFCSINIIIKWTLTVILKCIFLKINSIHLYLFTILLLIRLYVYVLDRKPINSINSSIIIPLFIYVSRYNNLTLFENFEEYNCNEYHVK